MNRALVVIAIALAACGQEEKKEPAPPAAGSDTAAGLALAQDPGQALSVKEAKAAAPKDEVVVAGRIRTIVKGFASFQLTDTALDYCGGGGDNMDDCATPWDYCCIPQDEVNEATLLVEAQDAKGNPLRTGLSALRLLDLVVVKGKLSKDEHGNVTVVATGWYRRERPNLREGLRWPE